MCLLSPFGSAVWIRLCKLPIELYDAEVLKQIGESIGKVLRIDSHTALEARGHASADVGVSLEVDGHYGPWMVVSKRTYGRKGTKPGVSTKSTRKSTWHSSSHLPPRNPEGLSRSTRETDKLKDTNLAQGSGTSLSPSA
nr:hypothetical protein CFP56_26199 [Quercus suber]